MLTQPTLFLITNCSATKRLAAGEALMLRKLTGSVRQKFHYWSQAITKKKDLVPARNCYAGDSWKHAIESESAEKEKSRLWVVSAGMGLISADLPIPNYSATFVSNDLDSVACNHSEKVEWWNLLAEWRRRLTGIGCIADLAESNPKAVFIVAVSSNYLTVIQDDLLQTRKALVSPNNLLVISSGTRQMKALGESLLPVDARFEHFLGGPRASLNARMLCHIVKKYKESVISAPMVSKYLCEIASKLAQPRTFARKQLSDEQIAEFIRQRAKLLPRPSASAVLRILRDEGSACEQKRFSRIYKTIYQAKE
jgi:hypothetical protein